jgi:carboxymethylenebutenolidase
LTPRRQSRKWKRDREKVTAHRLNFFLLTTGADDDPVRAEAIQTSSRGLNVGMGEVPVAGGKMPAYFARPADVERPPIILVCMEIFGLHEWVKDITGRIGHLGAIGVAPDYYFRSESSGIDLTKMDNIQNLLPIVNSKADTELYADLDAAVAWAKSQGGNSNRLGIIGFCRGGRNVLLYSTHNPDLKAGAVFYGSLIDKNDAASRNSIELASELKTPIVGLYGADDAGIKIEQINEMQSALKAAGKTSEFDMYPDALHGFMADYRASYGKEAADDAWSQMITWFKKYDVLF